MSDWLDSFREDTERIKLKTEEIKKDTERIRLETEEIKKETERLREENRKLRALNKKLGALSPEKLDEIVKNSTVDRMVINTTDNVGLPTYPNSILDVRGNLMTDQRNTIKEKLTQPYLTYEQGVMDCWNYLYYEVGMKDLADQMLEYLCE